MTALFIECVNKQVTFVASKKKKQPVKVVSKTQLCFLGILDDIAGKSWKAIL